METLKVFLGYMEEDEVGLTQQFDLCTPILISLHSHVFILWTIIARYLHLRWVSLHTPLLCFVELFINGNNHIMSVIF